MKTQHDRQLINSHRRFIPALPFRVTRPAALGICALLLCSALLCSFSSVATSQTPQDEDSTRKIWDTAFGAAGSKPAKPIGPTRNQPKRGYRVATPRVPPVDIAGNAVLGVTIWRLRPSKDADAGERIIVHEGADAVEWIPERVKANAALADGDRVRVSIEVARTGYLYVIDRERYADGTLGDPYLIFPTTRTLGGDNQVTAGRLVDIPAQDDSPPFFTLKRSRTDQVGEQLTVIITTALLDALPIDATAQKLSAERVDSWEKSWGGAAGRLELSQSTAGVWTKEEKEAGASTARLLNAHAPNPQAVYYRPGLKSDQPLLIKVQLQYRRRQTPATARRKST